MCIFEHLYSWSLPPTWGGDLSSLCGQLLGLAFMPLSLIVHPHHDPNQPSYMYEP